MKRHTVRLTTPQLALTLYAVKGLAIEMCDPTHDWTPTDQHDCSRVIDTLTQALYPQQAKDPTQ